MAETFLHIAEWRKQDVYNERFTTCAIFVMLPFTRVMTGRQYYSENTAWKYLDNLVNIGILENRMISGSAYHLKLELYRILSE